MRLRPLPNGESTEGPPSQVGNVRDRAGRSGLGQNLRELIEILNFEARYDPRARELTVKMV